VKTRFAELALQIVFLEIDLDIMHILRRTSESGLKPFELFCVGGRVVALEDANASCFLQTVSPAVKAGAEQDELLSAGMNRFADHIVDEPRSDDARDSCAGAAQEQNSG